MQWRGPSDRTGIIGFGAAQQSIRDFEFTAQETLERCVDSEASVPIHVFLFLRVTLSARCSSNQSATCAISILEPHDAAAVVALDQATEILPWLLISPYDDNGNNSSSIWWPWQEERSRPATGADSPRSRQSSGKPINGGFEFLS